MIYSFVNQAVSSTEGWEPSPTRNQKGILSMPLNYIWWWVSYSTALSSVEYAFIDMDLNSSLTRNSSICLGIIYVSNSSVYKFVLNEYIWCHITVCKKLHEQCKSACTVNVIPLPFGIKINLHGFEFY